MGLQCPWEPLCAWAWDTLLSPSALEVIAVESVGQ